MLRRKQMTKPRKKYDANKHLKNPVNLYEQAEKLVILDRIRQALIDNSLTFNQFEYLTILHRNTFYAKYFKVDINEISARKIIERIFNESILPHCTWDEESQSYKSCLSRPLKIHNTRREILAQFTADFLVELTKITDRREYAQILYHGLVDHTAYCNLTKSEIMRFIDKKNDAVTKQSFAVSAKLFKVDKCIRF
jgi:hypothetical protein